MTTPTWEPVGQGRLATMAAGNYGLPAKHEDMQAVAAELLAARVLLVALVEAYAQHVNPWEPSKRDRTIDAAINAIRAHVQRLNLATETSKRDPS